MPIERQDTGMLVQNLMTTDVVTVHREATLRDAVEQLLGQEVGSAIAMSDESNPIGIVTETDVLHAAYRTRDPLGEISVSELSNRPVVTTKPETTVQTVARKMADEEVKKVPVMDDLDLVGIVTLTDIVWHLSEIRKEAAALEEAHSQWDPDGSD